MALGLGEPWTRRSGIPQGDPLSMMLLLVVFAPWRGIIRAREAKAQLYADNLKVLHSSSPQDLLLALQDTAAFVTALGQELAPKKCWLMSTSKARRRRMKDWRIDGAPWKVRLDACGLGGHLNTTFCPRAGTSVSRIKGATRDVRRLRAYPGKVEDKARLVASKYHPRAFWGAEGVHVADKHIVAYRSASAMRLAPTPLTAALRTR